MIKCDNICLTLAEKNRLSHITLDINNEGISCIIGANGAGKTLLLKLFSGLLSISSGHIHQQVTRPPEVTLVPQKPIFLDKNVRDNIRIALRHKQKNRGTQKTSTTVSIDAKIDDALAWADITTLGHTPAHLLSAGQQQLVALARAWALSPKLLLLDEPTANLDPQRQQHIESLINTLAQSHCKIIMSSHNMEQVRRLANDVIFLKEGQLISHSKKDMFFNSMNEQTIFNHKLTQ